MRKVYAIIEQASDGNFSIYMNADGMSYLVTGTGKTVEEARKMFEDGYEDIKKYYAENRMPFEEVEFCYRCASSVLQIVKAKVFVAKGSDGTYDATMEYNEAIPFGLLGQGKTVKEAIDDFYNSFEEAKQMLADEGKECPEIEFEFCD